MTKLSTFPGVSKTGVLCTAAIEAAYNSGVSEIEYDDDGIFQHGEIAISNPNLRRVVGAGRIKQQASGNCRIFSGAGLEDLLFEGLRIEGAYAPGQTNYYSQNYGLVFTESLGIRLQHCDIRNVQGVAVHSIGCEDFKAFDVLIKNCGLGVYLRGGKNQDLNLVKVRDTLLADSVFTIGIALESTDGHSYGVPKVTRIKGCTVSGYRNAQGIMAHSALDLKMIGNDVFDAAISMSINPYNPTDDVSRIHIIGNNLVGPVTLPGYSGGNPNIIAQGGPASGGGMTPRITDLHIIGNTCTNGNRAENRANEGAIRIGYTKRANVLGNTVCAAWQNGIVLTADEQAVNVHGNIIQEVMESNGTQTGILVLTGGVSGYIGDNPISDLTSANGIGIKANGSNPNLNVNADCTTNVTTPTVGTWGAGPAATGQRPSRTMYSGSTCDLSDVEIVYLAHTSTTVIDNWIGAEPGKEYQLVFLTDKVTIGRTNAWLNGSAAFTGGFDDIMEIMGRTSTTIRQMSAASVNG